MPMESGIIEDDVGDTEPNGDGEGMEEDEPRLSSLRSFTSLRIMSR